MIEDERAEFYVRTVSVMDCTPGNYDHAAGEPASIITLGNIKSGEINPWALSMRDSRLLAVKLLVALATNHDKFAQRVLDEQFAANEEGEFVWPNDADMPSTDGWRSNPDI